MNNTIKLATATTIANGIHSGEVTHHHDQLIVLVNFNTRNIRNRTVPKPILEFDFSDILFTFYFYKVMKFKCIKQLHFKFSFVKFFNYIVYSI